MKKTLLAAATGALLVLSLQGCGGGGTPSKDDLSAVLADTGGVEADVADCVADELLDSDLSDDQLNAIADDDESDLDADEQAEVVEALTSAIGSCLTP
jgi:hypothetical protein